MQLIPAVFSLLALVIDNQEEAVQHDKYLHCDPPNRSVDICHVSTHCATSCSPFARQLVKIKKVVDTVSATFSKIISLFLQPTKITPLQR